MLVSFFTLFHMSTMEGWVTVMRSATDAVGVGVHPVQDYNFWTGFIVTILFMLTVILSSNLFVSAFVNSFDQKKSEIDGQRVHGGLSG